MKTQTVILVLLGAIFVIYYIWTKFTSPNTDPYSETKRPLNAHLPTQEVQNDKLVIVNNATSTEMDSILTSFCNMYNQESYQSQPRLFQISEKQFAITFPYNTDFVKFCFFVNYVHYPAGFKKSFDVTGWTTTKSGQTWITEKSANKSVMLFIPLEDTEYDNVYLTTEDNIGYKLGFAVGHERQLLNSPNKYYTKPQIEIEELAKIEYKDYK